MRARLWRVWKLPNPRISTLSPDRSARTMLSNIVANNDVGFLEGHPNGLVNLFGQIGPVHLAQRNVRCTANRHIYFPRGYQWWLSVLHRRRRGMDVAQELRPEGSRHPRPFLQIRSEDAAGNVACHWARRT
jgi:hypothetical protein